MKTDLRATLIALLVTVGPGIASAQQQSDQPMDGAMVTDMAYGNCCDDACGPPWAHRSTIFGEFIYLRPRNAEVAYGVPIDGAIAPVVPNQVGPVGVVDHKHEPGFRVGGSLAVDSETSIGLSYSALEGQTSDAFSVTAPTAINSLILHPGTANAGANFLDAAADYGLDFDLVDLDYRRVVACGERYAVNYLIGLRYARLEQDLAAQFTNSTTIETVITDVNFDGTGPRFGLDYERHGCNSGFMTYGRVAASFVPGEFGARYRQFNTADPSIIDTTWEADRLVSILDLEIGGGWQSRSGAVRVTVGYLISAWYNTVQTDEFIQSVQNNSFVGLNEDMTFDGYTVRGEFRF